MSSMNQILAANYEARLHAMQSGVEMDNDVRFAPGDEGYSDDLKHLRVGINSAKCDHTALVRLLISKGIITSFEYNGAILNEMDREVARYEEMLSKKLGKEIKLE